MKNGNKTADKPKRFSGVVNNVKEASKPKQKELPPSPLPRIPKERLSAIYDEYGFPNPNISTVQKTLPNDETKLRQILDVHQKAHMNEMKIKAQMRVDNLKGIADRNKAAQKAATPVQKPQAPQYAGMGGPGGPMPAQPEPPRLPPSGPEMPGMPQYSTPIDISQGGMPFFVGNSALIKLVNPGVQSDNSPIWYVDVKNKVMRPFQSVRAFDTYFGGNPEAHQAVVTLPSHAVGQGAPLDGFKMMNMDYGIRDDGSMRALDYAPASIAKRYGQASNPDAENKAVLALDGMLKQIGKQQPVQQSAPQDAQQGGMGGPGWADGQGGPGDPPPANLSNMGPGMPNNVEDVKKLQQWLMDQGLLKISAPTGYYGDLTRAAMAAWQKQNGMNVDSSQSGFYGPQTRTKMQAVSSGSGTQTGTQSGGTPAGTQTDVTNTDTGSSTSTTGGSSTGTTGDTTTTKKYMYDSANRDSTLEQNAYMGVYGMLNAPQNNTASGISKAEIDKINANPELLAMYVGALAYGGYTLGDVYKDMKRREMIDNGDRSVESMVIISPTVSRTDYAATPEGQAATSNPVFKDLNPAFGNIDPSIFNLPIFNVDDKLFQQLVPIMDPNSPEFKAEKDKIQSTLYDIMQLQINAKTEEEKAAADWEYRQFTETLQKTYGIQLANDATAAWAQIENLGKNYTAQGIGNSGIEAGAVDDYLKTIRQKDKNLREEKMTKQMTKDAAYYTASASPAQIKALIEEDMAKGLPRDQWRATQWGLVPSQTTIDALSMDALRAKYPGTADSVLQNMRDSLLDENGNYRSNVFQNQWNSSYNQFDPNSVVRQRDLAVNNAVMQNSLNKEQQAYADFTKVGSSVIGSPMTQVGGSQFGGAGEPGTPSNPATVAQAAQNTQPLSSGASTQSQEETWKRQAVEKYGKSILGMNTTFSFTQAEKDAINAGTYLSGTASNPTGALGTIGSVTPASGSTGTSVLTDAQKSGAVKAAVNAVAPTPTPTPQPPTGGTSSTPTATAPKTYSTLYDYYSSQGKTLSAPSLRFNDPAFAAAAQKAGVTKDQYLAAGSNNATLNTQILKYLT